MNDDDRLVRLAADIADGAPIQWSTIEAASVTDDERELLRELRLLERLADVHSRHGADRSADASQTARNDGMPLEAGASWGPLRIVERIGEGTFGEVYRAFDERLDRDVALKLLRPHAVHGAAVETLPESSVVEEGRLMARVRHPGVVTVHGAERVDGRVGVWMELVDGCTLSQDVAARGRLPPARGSADRCPSRRCTCGSASSGHPAPGRQGAKRDACGGWTHRADGFRHRGGSE